jgi:6-phosphogluconolactonase
MMSPRVHCFANADEAGKAGAAHVANVMAGALRARGTCRVALAGGSTPRHLYRCLAAEPYRSLLPWAALDIFWSDERTVPPSHADSNYAMACDTLLHHVSVDWRHVHRIEGEIDPASAAGRYEATIRDAFRGERSCGSSDLPSIPRFDLVLLGVGADGHTASLFPGTRALDERGALMAANHVTSLRTTRITMTLPLINAARHVLFMVTGEEKAAAVRLALESAAGAAVAPAARVRPREGRVDWILDTAAARLIQCPAPIGEVMA